MCLRSTYIIGKTWCWCIYIYYWKLVFSVLNHDLGKLGDDNESYIPQTVQLRKEKLGEDYILMKN